MPKLPAWLSPYLPAPVSAGRRERLLACLGAGLGLLLTELISRAALGASQPWFVAPMGASAVLLFAAPASPLAQPWSVVGGNTVAALIGVACVQWLPSSVLAVACAGTLAIAVMFALRCLHPPSGAVALTAVIGGPAIQQLGYGFALWPVALNSLLLAALAVLFHRLSGRRYPHHPQEHAPAAANPQLGVNAADLNAALAAHHELMDVSQDDLESVLLDAEERAYRRHFGEIRCADAMSPLTHHLSLNNTLVQARQTMLAARQDCLPIMDDAGRLLGMAMLAGMLDTAGKPLPDLLQPSPPAASPDQAVTEWVRVLSGGHYRWLPVTGEDGRCIGLLTQADLITALYRASVEQA